MQIDPRMRLVTLRGEEKPVTAKEFYLLFLLARLMFASEHDLLLAIVLLVFASSIATSVGYFFATALTDSIQALNEAARAVAECKLRARIEENGRDEMEHLGHSFNEMASQLHAVEQKQKELENLRRDLIAWVSHDLRTPLTDLVSDTIESFSELAKHQGIQLSGSIAPGTDPLFLDAQRISRVLANLVSNALRHTPSGGMVNICAAREGSHVIVEVEDSGEGIKPEYIAHVFECFYRGEKSRNRATGGAGLGLAIACSFILSHGGQIDVESTPGKGTRFFFRVPVQPEGPFA